MQVKNITPTVKRSGLPPKKTLAQDKKTLSNLMSGMSLAGTSPAKGSAPEIHKPQYNSKDDIYLYANTFKRQVKIEPFYKVLILEDADYSFARNYVTTYPHCSLMTTRHEADNSDKKRTANIKFLKQKKIPMYRKTDPTEVSDYIDLQSFAKNTGVNNKKGVDKIFFNFSRPIYNNGQWLVQKKEIQPIFKQFIKSAQSLLAPGGEIIIGGYSDHFRKTSRKSLSVPKQSEKRELCKPPYNSKDDIYLYAKTFKSQVKIGSLYKVLTLGEADYSFARAYMTAYPHCSMMATRYEKDNSVKYSKLNDNIDFLTEKDVLIYKNVDATKIGSHKKVQSFRKSKEETNKKGFDKIFFNFPYLPSGTYAPAKTAVPAILRQFIQSARPLLAPGGEIIVGGYSDWYRSQYYTVKNLHELGFSLPKPDSTFPKSSDWDKHGLLSNYGYNHRDSGQDFSTNDEPNFENSKRYVYVKTT